MPSQAPVRRPSSFRNPTSKSSRRWLGAALLGLAATVMPACGDGADAGQTGAQGNSPEGGPVEPARLYVALDQEHSESLVRRFTETTGIEIETRFDTEANKTVGLTSAIIEERDNPRCSVFWNNEVAQTVRLAQQGLLVPYESPNAADIPAQFKPENNLWTGFAARARILIVNTEKLPNRDEWPTSMWDLTDPKWKGKCGVARPLTGTTLTHFAALHAVLGEAKFNEWLDGMDANDVVYLASNGATMRAVRDGDLLFAWTDTDDFHVALDKGYPVAAVFPDQGEDEIGTMLIENSVALVKGGPNPEVARKLVDYIVSREVEALLAASKSAQIPVREGVAGPKDVQHIGTFKEMAWDRMKVGQSMTALIPVFADRFGND